MQPAFPFGDITEEPGRFCEVVGNKPLRRPGVYGLFDRRNGKWYIGLSSSLQVRRYDQERHVKNPGERPVTAFIRSVERPEDLVFVPLFYMLPVRRTLFEVESNLIRAFGCVAPSGYNVIESYRDPTFWARTFRKEGAAAKRKATLAVPEQRERITAHLRTPEMKAKLRAGLTPEAYSRASASRHVTMAEPEWRARQSAIMTEVSARPKVNARRSASVKASWERRR